MDLSSQFRGLWDKKIRREMEDREERYLQGMSRRLVWDALGMMKGFFNVTGNLITSLAIGVYRDGVLKHVSTSLQELGKAPTRATLRKGEAYTLPYYWGNDKAFNRAVSRPYIGETGSGGKYGPAQAVEFLSRHVPRRRRGLAFVVVVAVDYAKYTETKDGANVLTAFREKLKASGAEVSVIKG